MKNAKIRYLYITVFLLVIFIVITKVFDIPFIGIVKYSDEEYSIGVYSMDSDSLPLRFSGLSGVSNPVITACDVTDRNAHFVADPFLIYEKGIYYMFFEILGEDNGDIGLAVSSNGEKWTYEKVVLDEPFHLSYPHVFKHGNIYYMIPETYEKEAIRLYKAIDFPYTWQFVMTLIEGRDFVDSTIFRYSDKWWIFTAMTDSSNLFLYWADDIKGVWTEHPLSPVVKGNRNTARPAGNVIQLKDSLIRIAQDDYPYYGNAVRAFEIVELNTQEYIEKELQESPLFEASGKGWNKDGMHQLSTPSIDNNSRIVAVDGLNIKKRHRIYIEIPSFFAKMWEKIQ